MVTSGGSESGTGGGFAVGITGGFAVGFAGGFESGMSGGIHRNTQILKGSSDNLADVFDNRLISAEHFRVV